MCSCHRFQISVVMIHFRFIKAVGDNSPEVRDHDSSNVLFILCTLSAKTVTCYRTLFYRLEKSRLHYKFIIG